MIFFLFLRWSVRGTQDNPERVVIEWQAETYTDEGNTVSTISRQYSPPMATSGSITTVLIHPSGRIRLGHIGGGWSSFLSVTDNFGECLLSPWKVIPVFTDAASLAGIHSRDRHAAL